VPSFFLRLEQSNFLTNDQYFGVRILHGHFEIDLWSLIFSCSFILAIFSLVCITCGHHELDRVDILLLFFLLRLVQVLLTVLSCV
jgi:hypothetical protein